MHEAIFIFLKTTNYLKRMFTSPTWKTATTRKSSEQPRYQGVLTSYTDHEVE